MAFLTMHLVTHTSYSLSSHSAEISNCPKSFSDDTILPLSTQPVLMCAFKTSAELQVHLIVCMCACVSVCASWTLRECLGVSWKDFMLLALCTQEPSNASTVDSSRHPSIEQQCKFLCLTLNNLLGKEFSLKHARQMLMIPPVVSALYGICKIWARKAGK